MRLLGEVETMNQDLKFYLIWVLFMICLSGILIWVVLSVHVVRYQYEMPNGVMCNYKTTVSAGFGGAGIEFKKCNDGKTYINPENYKRLKR